MSDARSLLRQQRAARRIQHPHAQYTAPGKLSCSVCHEPIKSDALWDSHIRSAAHRQRLLAAAKGPRAPVGSRTGSAEEPKSKSGTDTLSDEALLAHIISGAGQKRKHDGDGDLEMGIHEAAAAEGEEEANEAVPTKRSRSEIGSPSAPASLSALNAATANGSLAKTDSQPDKDTDASKRTHAGGTPPELVRRISGTPSHGVELQIPSRPATPSVSAASTPKATPMGRSPLIPQDSQMAGLSSSSKPPPKAAFASTAASESAKTAMPPAAGNEDDDWAAFESEVVHAAAAAPPRSTLAAAAGYAGDAVIAAAPMTAQELAAKQEEEARERRRVQADVDLEDEKEEATRALETEFEEMEELEARVRKLKEKRDAIRRGSVPSAARGSLDAPNPTGVAEAATAPQPVNGTAEADEEEPEDDDDDGDDEEDDWAGFRFRA